MAEHRTSQRRRVLKGAIAAFNGRNSTMPCTVRDISSTGCRLTVDHTVAVPDTFELIVELDGTIVPCQVVRRSPKAIGVLFVGPVETRTPARVQVVEPVLPAATPTLRKSAPKRNFGT